MNCSFESLLAAWVLRHELNLALGHSKTPWGPWTRNSEGPPNQWYHFGWGLPWTLRDPWTLSTHLLCPWSSMTQVYFQESSTHMNMIRALPSSLNSLVLITMSAPSSSGLELVLRCEPSTYQLISRWLSHCAIGALECVFVTLLFILIIFCLNVRYSTHYFGCFIISSYREIIILVKIAIPME